MHKKRKIQIGAAKVDAITMNQLLKRLDGMIEDGKSHYVSFCDAHLCVRATRESDSSAILDRASLVLPDGVSMTAGARLLGKKFPERLPGPTVMLKYCRHGLTKNRRHFFYGGAEGVAECLIEKFLEKMPDLQIAGAYCPPFRPLTQEEEIKIKNRIEESETDVLWVGLGAPKQEKWMADHIEKINVPLMLGVGAAFDFHSGKRRWAPKWIRKIGLEWLYRMITGGRRIFFRNLKYDSAFLWLIIKELISKKYLY
jgi:N-acetylglucosaminyldiphosphoundecaprenol N-acetyl-beta-D-mannosaminyltransferase